MSDTIVIRTAAPIPLRTYLNPAALWRDLSRNSDLIRQFAGREVLERHKGAVLGVLWNILNPLLTLAVYTAVFGFVLGVHWERHPVGLDLPDGATAAPMSGLTSALSFALTLLCGHTLAHLFVECINRAPGLVAGRPNLVRRVVFPLQILPLTVLLSSLVYVAMATAVLLVVLFAATGGVPATAVAFPLVLVPLVLLTLGLSWVLAAVGVFVRDARHVVIVLSQVVMLASAVFYPVERVPARFRWLVDYNPLAASIDNARRSLLWGEWPRWEQLAVMTVGGLLAAQVGYAFFMKCRRGMADVV